jgi:hypothetical protein
MRRIAAGIGPVALALLLSAACNGTRATGGDGGTDTVTPAADTPASGGDGPVGGGDTGGPGHDATGMTGDAVIPPDSLGPVTYYKDVQPIVQANCQECHVAGGIGPFPLTSFTEVKAQVNLIVDATGARIMPPWKPADDCRPLQHVRRLTDMQIATLAAWKAQGTPEGDPADAPPPPPPPPQLPPPDLMMKIPQRYMPNQQLTDDYRCFLVDPGLTQYTHVTGFDVEPENKKIVHHVLLYVISPDNVAEAQMLDAQEAGPGYTCFGGPGTSGNVNVLGGWAPGSQPFIYHEGTGISLPAGSQIAVQVHYNVPNGPGTDDQTSFGLYLSQPGQTVQDAYQVPFPITDLYVPAGQDGVVVSKTQTLPVAGKVYAIIPHMHLRGHSIDVKVQHADGTEECVINVPQWDFHWQLSYAFVEPLNLAVGDKVIQTCVYNNSAASQPIGPDGMPLTPTDLYWGEKTTDEMCLTFSYVTAGN